MSLYLFNPNLLLLLIFHAIFFVFYMIVFVLFIVEFMCMCFPGSDRYFQMLSVYHYKSSTEFPSCNLITTSKASQTVEWCRTTPDWLIPALLSIQETLYVLSQTVTNFLFVFTSEFQILRRDKPLCGVIQSSRSEARSHTPLEPKRT